ncbi:MBL fold metallo-hydrolase [Lentibacillus sediminis]|uniref:MBL fold metallo-hydrolase n=1 Tax=Lentibacillus sediminis TaxID=1940529 RepID=UPI000C1BF920|nr:MBL fold metallo-hydrolase [Lentibacillus sediminis]
MQVLDKTIKQLTVPTPFAVGDVHVYLLKGDMLSLVDAGVKTKEAWQAVTEQLKESGYHPEDIEQIILTHHHPDHTGLIEQFPRLKHIAAHQNVDVWLRRDEAYFRGYEHFFHVLFIQSGIPARFQGFLDQMRKPLILAGRGEVTDALDEGDTLPGHGEWQVIETKGHAQSHLSFFRQEDGLFIGGDHLLKSISPNPLIEPPGDPSAERPRPILQYRRNLQKCLELGITKVLPGHGDVFSDLEEILPKQMKRQVQRAEKVYQLIAAEAQSPFQLCQKIFPRQYESQLELTMSETFAQLDYLEDEGKIEQAMEEGRLMYAAK